MNLPIVSKTEACKHASMGRSSLAEYENGKSKTLKKYKRDKLKDYLLKKVGEIMHYIALHLEDK